jgi:hypothetical protein
MMATLFASTRSDRQTGLGQYAASWDAPSRGSDDAERGKADVTATPWTQLIEHAGTEAPRRAS